MEKRSEIEERLGLLSQMKSLAGSAQDSSNTIRTRKKPTL